LKTPVVLILNIRKPQNAQQENVFGCVYLIKQLSRRAHQFDAVYDAGYEEYLSSDGQTIIDERREGYEKYIGD